MIQAIAPSLGQRWTAYRAWWQTRLDAAAPRTRWLFLTLAALLSLYLTGITYTAYSSVFMDAWHTAIAVCLSLALASVFFHLLAQGCWLLSRRGSAPALTRGRFPWGVFTCVTLVCAAVLGLCWLAYYPGFVSPDVLDQWAQLQSGHYADWHPVAHTLLLWLLNALTGSYAGVTLAQALLFSLGFGYLMATLRRWGVRGAFLALATAVALLNQNTLRLLLIAWKDSLLTIALVPLAAMLVEIYGSDGAWLRPWRHWLPCALLTGVATLLRHNAFFYTGPMVILVLVLYARQLGWRRCVALTCVTAGLVAGVRGPLYQALDVQRDPDQTFAESVGLPMTILGDIMHSNSEMLSGAAWSFLTRIAPEEAWAERYTPGSFNSIKFASNSKAVLAETNPAEFLSMVWEAACWAPREAFLAVRELTGVVWSISGEAAGQNTLRIQMEESHPALAYPVLPDYESPRAEALSGVPFLITLSDLPLWHAATTLIGVYLLALLLAALWAVYRHGAGALLLALPSLVYNFGTMLLLSGPDYRFFHFNVVISLPLCLALLHKARAASAASAPPT